MRTNLGIFLLIPLMLTLFSGCFTGGSFLSQNVTNVELTDSEFTIVAKDLEGYSKAEYLLGFSYSSGFLTNTAALVRIGGSAKLYNDAIKNLWKNYQAKYGETEGKKLLLANIRYDTDILNLFVYTQTELYIHADVIEFEE